MVQELIKTYLHRSYDGETGQFYTLANILTTYCDSRVAVRARDISISMNRLGYVQCRVGNLRGWNVVPLYRATISTIIIASMLTAVGLMKHHNYFLYTHSLYEN